MPDLDRRIGKRWPARFLNFLPPSQLWRYLTWRSGGEGLEPDFTLGKALAESRRILIVMPETFQDLLVSLPAVQAVVNGIRDAAFTLIAGPQEGPFLGAIFGRERILTLEPDEFFLGEEHFRTLIRVVQGFRPDLTLNFRRHSPPLVHFLVRSSLSPLRVQIADDAPRPFANITLLPGDKANLLRRYLMVLQLWESTGKPLPCKWVRLSPSQDNLEKARALLASKQLKGEKTALFLWQDQPEREQSALVRETAARLKPAGKTLAVLHGTNSAPGAAAPAPHIAAEFPTLSADATGMMLGLFASASGVHGMNGPLLQLAGLCETDVEGFFQGTDAAYDTAFLNPRLKINWSSPAAKP